MEAYPTIGTTAALDLRMSVTIQAVEEYPTIGTTVDTNTTNITSCRTIGPSLQAEKGFTIKRMCANVPYTLW